MYVNGIKHVARQHSNGADLMFMDWSINNFPKFAFDILALLNGTYDPSMISSFQGLGSQNVSSENV